jgi:hypothetical protein
MDGGVYDGRRKTGDGDSEGDSNLRFPVRLVGLRFEKR